MTDLSPAAQAVLDAVDQVPRVLNCTQDHPLFAAAALRAVADQVQMDKPLGDTDADAGVFAAHHAILAHLLAIAAELEQLND
jgi:hypothetical protein